MNKKPSQIGYYSVVKRIGHGSFAKVDLAVHVLLNVKVAIKIIDRKKATFQKHFNKFLDEIEIYRELSHRHIIKLFEVLKSERSLYLIMEYAPRGDLYSILNIKAKFSEPEARHYFRQMVSALIYSHAKGYAHRDLKLENIFLDEFNDIKIGDYGLAGKLRPSALMSTSCGSPRYAAPEILKGKLYSGELADVWSCGVILFTFLAGYNPFDDDVYVSLLQKIKRSHYTLPPELSAEAVDLIRRALQPDCNRRITMGEIMCHPWVTHTSFPKYVDCKLIQVQSKSQGVVKRVLDPELVEQLAQKAWDFPPRTRPELAAMVAAGEDHVFVVAFNLVQFEQGKQARLDRLAANHVAKTQSFRLGFLRDIFARPDKAEGFQRTFRAYTIDLFRDFERRPWRIGLNFYSNLKRVLRTFVRAANCEAVRVEILSGVEYRFRCFCLDASRERSGEAFLVQVFRNSSDEYVLDLVNENMANLKFVMLCFKLFRRMKV